MGIVEERLASMGIIIKAVDRMGSSVVGIRIYGSLLFLSGVYPIDENGELAVKGKAGIDLGIEDICRAGRYTAIAALSVLKDEIGNLDRVDCIVRCLGYINAGGTYSDLPAAMNGFSDVMTAAFGHRGRHTRAAVGVTELNGGAAMTVNMVVKLKENSLYGF